MPKDLTSSFSTALARSDQWSRKSALEFARTLAKAVLRTRTDWDQDAGEEWVRVVRGKKVLAAVWVRGPIAFLDSKIAGSIFKPPEVECVTFEGWESEAFSIDRARLDEFFGAGRWSDEIDAALFSPNDLWWTTV